MNEYGTHNEDFATHDASSLPWGFGWHTLKSVWPKVVYISAASLAIPQYCLYIGQSIKAWNLGELLALSSPQPSRNIMFLIESFSLGYLSYALLTYLIALLGSLTLIAMLVQYLRAKPLHLGTAVKLSLQVLFPYGIFVISAILGTAFLAIESLYLLGGQLLSQIFVIAAAVLLAPWPVIMMLEPRQPIQALFHAITLRYIRHPMVRKISVFTAILTLEMAWICVVSLSDFFQEKILDFDQTFNLSRNIWYQTSLVFPLGVVSSITEAFFISIKALSFGIFITFLTSFVFALVMQRGSPGARIAVLT